MKMMLLMFLYSATVAGKRTVNVTKGSDVVLQCNLNRSATLPEWRGPPDDKIYSKPQKEDLNTDVTSILENRTHWNKNSIDLNITSVQKADEGNYLCSYGGNDIDEITLVVTDNFIYDCGALPNISNGTAHGNGTSAYVNCIAGYNASNSTIICQENGTWSSAICVPVDCGALPNITHGTIHGNRTILGVNATVNCSDGYSASSSTITCQENGTWSSAICVHKETYDSKDVPGLTPVQIALIVIRSFGSFGSLVAVVFICVVVCCCCCCGSRNDHDDHMKKPKLEKLKRPLLPSQLSRPIPDLDKDKNNSIRQTTKPELHSRKEIQTNIVIKEHKSRFDCDYEDIEFLDIGGVGWVFKAKNKLDQCYYAIKRICLLEGDAKEMNREVNALSQLTNDSIVTYYYSWTESPLFEWQKQKDKIWIKDSENSKRIGNNSVDNKVKKLVPDFSNMSKTGNSKNNECRLDLLYIQMQWCEKRTLENWLSETSKKRDIPDALAKFEQIIAAVQYVHDKKMILSNIKPVNIFLTLDDGNFKIGDFGLSWKLQPMLDSAGCAKQDTSHSADSITELYISPEMKQGNYSEKVDIYALGMLLLELIYPMTPSERIGILTSAKDGTFPKPPDKRREKMFEYVKPLLSSDPKQRPSARDTMENVKSLEKLFEEDENISQKKEK